jgi:hypothetical protein
MSKTQKALRRVTDPNAYTKLVVAQQDLRRVRDYITPEVAPRVAQKVRRLLKSVDGAIRNAHGHDVRSEFESGHPATLSGVSK